MQTLYVRRGKRYRVAVTAEILDAAASIVVAEATGATLSSPQAAAELCRSLCAGYETERFGVLWLDTRHRVIHSEVLFTGTIDGASVYLRVVVKRALEHNAAAAILTHNHPSGVARGCQIGVPMRNAYTGLRRNRELPHVVGRAARSLVERGISPFMAASSNAAW